MSRRSYATLLIGFDPRTALAVARSLWRADIRVVVATIAEWETPLDSRAVTAFVKLPGPESSAPHFLKELEALIKRHEIDTIIPITDRALLMLSPCFDYMRSRVRIAGPNAEQAATILDKSVTNALAAKLGVPVPRSFSPESLGDELHQLPFPLFAKSRDKRLFLEGDTSRRPEAHFVEDAATLRRLLEESDPSALLVEEYVAGDDVGLAVLMKDGQVITSIQYRAELLFPAKGGVSVVARTEPVDEALLEAAVKLLRTLRWQGIAQFDFRHNQSTGKFAFLEINGRFWGSTAVAILAGLDLPLYVWQLAHDVPPSPAPTYCVGLRARWLEGDVRRLLLLISGETNPSWCSRIFETLGFLQRFRWGTSGMFWSWRDPWPALETTFLFTKFWLIGKLRRLYARRSLAGPTTLRLDSRRSLEEAAVIQPQNVSK